MRQRKIKNFEHRFEEILKVRNFKQEIKKYKGIWHEVFGNENPIFLELGCGKGNFINKKAAENKGNNYISIDGEKSAIIIATEKALKYENTNLLLAKEYVKDIEEYFEAGELAGIYLNFSDPWPKNRNAKRRLTYRNYLRGYKKVLNPNGFVEFKTDNDDLFDFTLEEIAEVNAKILEITRDLHSTDYEAALTMTEYEEKFKAAGKNINYVKIKP
ncbi:MAG: tRNA (guanosine(46)-N7)-methyltransferase TrmB [Eubacteriales bacterium]